MSENITVDEIKDLAEVLRRKPLIWDNLHANDYDQQRLFLGPFKGRPTALIPHLSGVLTNPNCEYSFNIPVLYTLGNWLRSYTDNLGEWDPILASKESIPHFINEMNRSTSVKPNSDDCSKEDIDNNDEYEEEFYSKERQFKACEVELLFHLYWLPHR